MNDAKKLDDARSTPAVDAHALIEVQAAEAYEPLIEFKSGEATRLSMQAPVRKQARSLARRLAVHMLVFFLIGLVMFGVGAGLAALCPPSAKRYCAMTNKANLRLLKLCLVRP